MQKILGAGRRGNGGQGRTSRWLTKWRTNRVINLEKIFLKKHSNKGTGKEDHRRSLQEACPHILPCCQQAISWLWDACSTPLYPLFLLLFCLFSLPRLWIKECRSHQPRTILNAPLASVLLELLGYCHNRSATAQNFRLTALQFDQGFFFFFFSSFAKTSAVIQAYFWKT